MRSLSVGPRLGVRSGLRGRAWLSSPVARKVLALGAAILLGSNPLLTGLIVRNVAAAGPSFVSRQGQQLTLDGQPFRFTGMNIYAANSDGWCGEDYTADQLRTAFDGIGSRDTVLRAWFFQTMAAQKVRALLFWLRGAHQEASRHVDHRIESGEARESRALQCGRRLDHNRSCEEPRPPCRGRNNRPALVAKVVGE